MAVDVKNIVIGAGVIGLAIARTLATLGRDVLVLESAAHFGDGTSSRNSEVIHAGIYYPKGSLKAIYCVEGKHRLYEYCKTHHVPHRSCGKLIVATSPEEIPTLEVLADKAAARRQGHHVPVRSRGHKDGTGASLHRRPPLPLDRHH